MGNDDQSWKLAVDHELTTLQSTADSFETPAQAVKALIDWHVSVSRDPALNEGMIPTFDQIPLPPAPTIQIGKTSYRQHWFTERELREHVKNAVHITLGVVRDHIRQSLDATGPGTGAVDQT